MTDERRKLMADALNKSEDILISLCRSSNSKETISDDAIRRSFVVLFRTIRILGTEVINFDDKTREYERRIYDLESELKMLVRG